MKFDILAESIITNLLNEGRLAKTSKYSNIQIDAAKLLNKLEEGDFHVLISSWANNARYANISEEKLTDLIKNISNEISEYQPSTYEELLQTISGVVDTVYENKGPNRKTLTSRLTKSIANLITHKEYGLVTVGEPKKETNKEEKVSEKEESALNFVNQSEEPSDYNEVLRHLTGTFGIEEDEAQEIINNLVNSGSLRKEGNSLIANNEEDHSARALDFENEEEDEHPLNYAPDVEATYRRTIGSDEDYLSSNY
jgi:hypothetical protein